jgi:hypothetical protein
VGTLLVAVGAVFTNARAIVIGLAIVVVMLGTAQVTATQSSARIRSCANTSGEQSGEGLTFDTSPDGNAATAQNPTGPDLLAKRFMATSGGFVTGSAAIVGSIVAILIAGLTNAGNWALVVGLALVLVVLGTAQVTATRSSARTRSRANTNGAQRREQCLHP